MTDLQIGIVVLAIVAILGVVMYNWWQEKKVQQRIHEKFPEPDRDPLINDIHSINPSQKEHTLSVSKSGDFPSVKKKHDDDGIDPLCEAVFDISFYTPVLGSQLISHIHPLKMTGNKPIRYFAETSDGFHRARLHPSDMYSSLQMAVLLSNRSGSLRVEEWDRAVVYADNIAQDFDGSIESGSKEQVLEQAQEVYALCNQLEAQVGVKLILEGTQPVKALLTVAARLGYTEYGHGHVRLHESGKPLFLLLLNGELSGDVRSAGVDSLELLIDVPNSQRTDKPFSYLVKQAHELAKALNAKVVDDQGELLSADNTVIPLVDEQLAKVYDDLDAKGFPAGSERAARVFS